MNVQANNSMEGEQYDPDMEDVNIVAYHAFVLEKMNICKKFISECVESRVEWEDTDSLTNILQTMDTEFAYYLMNTRRILSQYESICNKPVIIDYCQKRAHRDDDEALVAKNYFTVAQKLLEFLGIDIPRNSDCANSVCAAPHKKVLDKIHTRLDIKPKRTHFVSRKRTVHRGRKEKSPVCKNCSGKEFDEENSKIVCVDCGTENFHQIRSTSYKKDGRVNFNTKYEYDRPDNFDICIRCFQAKQDVVIDPSVYTKLDDILVKTGLISPDKSIEKKERYKNITPEIIRQYLKSIKYNQYKNTIYIWSVLTGKNPPDLSSLEHVLLDDFRELHKKFENMSIEERGRKSFPNRYYVLKILLRRHKFKFDESLFTVLKTSDCSKKHALLLKELFKQKGWSTKRIFI